MLFKLVKLTSQVYWNDEDFVWFSLSVYNNLSLAEICLQHNFSNKDFHLYKDYRKC